MEEEPQSYYRINGLNSVYLSITAEDTANQLQLNRAVMAEMEAVRQVLPVGYEVHTSYDATEYIREELDKIYFLSLIHIYVYWLWSCCVCIGESVKDVMVSVGLFFL